MEHIEDFQNRLNSLKSENLQKLFILLPEVERAENFGEIKGGVHLADGSLSFPYWSSSKLVDKTIAVINQLQLYPAFDWVNWQEGKSILQDKTLNYSELDSITLCKLLTVIIRQDRFNEGFLISCFENGIMTRIIEGLQKNFNSKSIF